MTKRDFELIADTLKVWVQPVVEDAVIYAGVAATFADQLAVTNDRFDRQRFLTACGVWA